MKRPPTKNNKGKANLCGLAFCMCIASLLACVNGNQRFDKWLYRVKREWNCRCRPLFVVAIKDKTYTKPPTHTSCKSIKERTASAKTVSNFKLAIIRHSAFTYTMYALKKYYTPPCTRWNYTKRWGSVKVQFQICVIKNTALSQEKFLKKGR